MKLYGLIGFPLTHSFSKKFFTEKFEKEGTSDQFKYELFEMENPKNFPDLFEKNPDLKGINITIPHKQNVFDYLDGLDQSAKLVGAVNVVKRLENDKLIGFNSDFYGFQRSLKESMGLEKIKDLKALVLGGKGGAAKAIVAALEDLGVSVQLVSRKAQDGLIDYAESRNLLPTHHLIVNCTPLGTYPKTEACPDIDYTLLTPNHFLFDLVYNPAETLFMKKGLEKGAQVKNGYDMLVYQAEKSWEIWQNETI
ncbi:shikimate dehydrogenase [Marinilongibacter aquaticus]|uniref:shikimate dehydrogenase family protein n=1 Tax=Marinilongibacter aquaticus TaxID=2975157 RepID=UPI0021BD8C1C|nr:shikimate dehydrogenase [Marinilongibacter aquaticus]UBM58119.1 shikimate dehydrogenase [Marinilongibacter aquaticus]